MKPNPTRSEVAAQRFFAATSAGDWEDALAVTADECTVWQNAVGATQRFRDALPSVKKMYDKFGPWEYTDVRRIADDRGCCEQHTVRFLGADVPIALDVAVVVRVGDDGTIVAIEEYFDQSAFDAARGRTA